MPLGSRLKAVGYPRLQLGWDLEDRLRLPSVSAWGDRVDHDRLFWDAYGFVAFGLWIEKAEFNGPN